MEQLGKVALNVNVAKRERMLVLLSTNQPDSLEEGDNQLIGDVSKVWRVKSFHFASKDGVAKFFSLTFFFLSPVHFFFSLSFTCSLFSSIRTDIFPQSSC